MNIVFATLGFATNHVFLDGNLIGSVECRTNKPEFWSFESQKVNKTKANQIIAEYEKQIRRKGIWINKKIVLAG